MPDFSAYEGNWTGVSFFVLRPEISQFLPPSGVLLHVEDGRLLPNYAEPSNERVPVYQIQRGGIYPSLSRRSALNLYLDLRWSSDCNGASNC